MREKEYMGHRTFLKVLHYTCTFTKISTEETRKKKLSKMIFYTALNCTVIGINTQLETCNFTMNFSIAYVKLRN